MGTFISHRMFVAALNNGEASPAVPETQPKPAAKKAGPGSPKLSVVVDARSERPWFELRVARPMLRPSC